MQKYLKCRAIQAMQNKKGAAEYGNQSVGQILGKNLFRAMD
jgi:hypothetical protein